MADGACRTADPDLFFSFHPGQAKAICAGCPVKAECLEYALDGRELYGVWGGLSQTELAALRVGRPEPFNCSECGARFHRLAKPGPAPALCSKACEAAVQGRLDAARHLRTHESTADPCAACGEPISNARTDIGGCSVFCDAIIRRSRRRTLEELFA